MSATFVVVGGGIAGVTCAETLAFLAPEEPIILVSESALIKTVTNLHAITRTLAHFDVEEQKADCLSEKYLNITVVHATLTRIDHFNKMVYTTIDKIGYKYLCLCMGASPKLIEQALGSPDVIGIRDTDSVETFIHKINKAKRMVIVGNGGIASELVYKVENVEIEWVVKDKHISATFVDPGAAEFFQTSLKNTKSDGPVSKRLRYKEGGSFSQGGAALGPDWYKNLSIEGVNTDSKLNIHYETEIASIKNLEDSDFKLEVVLGDGEVIQTDLVVSATGVAARLSFEGAANFKLGEDGGIAVDEFMESSVRGVYAAGDVCSAGWEWAKHWFPMRLWTQARQMGAYVAKAMVGSYRNEVVLPDFCFEMFAHSTKLFGYKVTLLGLYNGQKLGTNYEILLRMTKTKEYVKFVLEGNKLQGAVLIGDTDLEEMCENLILNQLDLEPYGDDILNPDIDIEDYFD